MAENTTDRGVAGRHVLLAGGTSAAGWEAARALRSAGARVTVAGRSPDKLAEFESEGFATVAVDLTDESAVFAMALTIGHVDGVLHLVGGWRGGGGIAGQTDADWSALESSLTAWRHVARAFWEGLVESDAARVAVVSSTVVARPLAGGANYAAVKAATEAWTRALAHGFAKDARDAGRELGDAAVIFRATTLEGQEGRLAAEFTALWDRPAAEVNDQVIELA